MEPGIEEGIGASRHHCKPVAQQLDEVEVLLVDQADVDVLYHVEDVQGQPADSKSCHHQDQQAKSLPPPGTVPLSLDLGDIAWDHTVLQLDWDPQVGQGDDSQRQYVGDDEGAVGISQAISFHVEPKLLTDGEVQLREFCMVGVDQGWGSQSAAQQPDSSQDVSTDRDGEPPAEGVHRGTVPVHSYDSQGEDRHKHSHRLHQENKVAHEAPINPSPGLKSIGQGQGHTGCTHEHVRESQIAYQKVGDIVHFFCLADDINEEVIPNDTNKNHQRVAGDDEWLEGLNKLEPWE